MATLILPTPSPSHPPPHNHTQLQQQQQQQHLFLLNQCKTIKHFHQIHALLIKTQQDPNKLISFISLSPLSPSHLPYALSIFSRIPTPDIFTWNSLIRSHTQASLPLSSISLFTRLLEAASPPPNAHTFPFLLKACTHLHSIPHALPIHAQILKRGLAADLHITTALITFYSICGDTCVARKVFDGCPHRTAAPLWNSMISGFVKSGCALEALELFHHMLRLEGRGLEPEGITIASVLAACSDLGALDAGEWVHDYAIKNGIGLNVFVGTALCDMYAKCGSIEIARKVFDEMPERNLMSWTVMIRGLAMCGRGADALALFSKMIGGGVKPDGVTLVAVLSACSHSGFLDEGHRIFASMARDFDIVPKSEHYSCMVDLFCRAGLLSDAMKFVEAMPLEPDAALWGSLLSACRWYPKNVELAEYVVSRLLEIEPHNDATYVQLSNIYAYNNRWDDVAKVRRWMKERAIRKWPGCSFVEVNGVVHEFIAGDRSHPQFKAIYSMVMEVVFKLADVGYVMDTSEVFLDIEEKEKQNALLLHSEKLALAFGLISSSPSATFRIVKNLRVCADCHNIMKHASKVYYKEIILRDRNRFHHFREGSCSCGDFW